MLLTKKTEALACLLIFCSVLIVSSPTSGKVFLRDDFENDQIGGKPKKWYDPGDQLYK